MDYNIDLDNSTYKKRLEVLRSNLDSERQSFVSHWKDLSEYILPTRGRFFIEDHNKGDRRNLNIIDATASLAIRTLRSGMMAGITSPARPWFSLGLQDTELSKFGHVRAWLNEVEKRMRDAFLRSNLYNALPILYGDMGTFGTAAMFMEKDLDIGTRFYTFPVGSYMISNDDKGRVRVFIREFQMTVRQVVEKFGLNEQTGRIDWSKISTSVKNQWERGQSETWVQIVHIVKKNEKYKPNMLESKYKKYSSDYYEKGLSSLGAPVTPGYLDGKFLSQKGYDYFPVLAPRWEVTGEDVYAINCPGMIALGDIKQLQIGEKRSTEAIEKMVRPPMVGPSKLRNAGASILPGDITFYDEREGSKGFRPAHEVRFDINALEMKQQQIRERISRCFYEDLFLMLANTDRKQITAREVEERHSEKLLATGPVLEQINQDLLDPLIDNQFSLMVANNELPPAPEEIEGVDIKVEYISIMAQAQKLTGLGGLERLAGFISEVSAVNPSVLDKVDFDKTIDIYHDLVGAPLEMLRKEDEVKEMRENREQAQALADQKEEALRATEGARNLGNSSMEEDSALKALVDKSMAGV